MLSARAGGADGAVPDGAQRTLRQARVQERGEQRLGDRVVQIARDPLALLDGALALAQPGLGRAPPPSARARTTTAARISVVSAVTAM